MGVGELRRVCDVLLVSGALSIFWNAFTLATDFIGMGAGFRLLEGDKSSLFLFVSGTSIK